MENKQNKDSDKFNEMCRNLCCAYTILEFGCTEYSDVIFSLRDNGKYSSYAESGGLYELPTMMHGEISVASKQLFIKKVRRESDGTEWSVGDKYVIGGRGVSEVLTIYKFSVYPDNGFVWPKEKMTLGITTTSVGDLRKPIYKGQGEILSFMDFRGEWIYSEELSTSQDYRHYCLDGDGCNRVTHPYALRQKYQYWIHSIRRINDDIIFKVGDYIEAPQTHMIGAEEIIGFEINERNLLVKTKSFNNHGVGIDKCVRVEPPNKLRVLYVTEDGVEIYDENEFVYMVPRDISEIGNAWKVSFKFARATIASLTELGWGVFGSFEKWEEYCNKRDTLPVLFTTFDGVEIFDKSQKLFGVPDDFKLYSQSAEAHIGFKVYFGKLFSTELARDEYIIKHRRMFSIDDLECYFRNLEDKIIVNKEELYAEARKRVKRNINLQ